MNRQMNRTGRPGRHNRKTGMVQTDMAFQHPSSLGPRPLGPRPRARQGLAALLLGAATLCLMPGLELGPSGHGMALAQDQGNPFAPVYIVNGASVTRFEIEQRALFIRALRLPGDPEKEAARLLIEDRLGAQAARAADITVTPDQVTAGMAEFAARANLSTEQFLEAIDKEGVAPETFHDFVQSGLLWRALVQKKFGGTTLGVTEAEIDRAIARTLRKPDIKLKLSELFLPAEGDAVAEVLDQARALRAAIEAGRLTFAEAARRFSAAPTKAQGGQLDWLPLSNLPPAVGQKLLTLGPGDVGDPMVVPNAVALFQMNDVADAAGPAPVAVQVEYAQYVLAADQDPAQILTQVDRCGDLNLVAKGQAADRLTLTKQMMAEVPADLGLELAKLDIDEATLLQRGPARVLLMLCQRQGLSEAQPAAEAQDPAKPAAADAPAQDAAANGSAPEQGPTEQGAAGQDAAAQPAPAAEQPAAPVDPDLPAGLVAPNRAAVREQLVNQRLEQLAAAYMEELRSEAIIVTRE